MSEAVKRYYSQRFIHFLMVKFVFERSIDFIVPRAIDPNGIAFRYRRAVSPDSLLFFLDKFNIYDKPFNIYASCAKINKTFPIISMDKDEAKTQREHINKEWHGYVTGYDLKFDLDSSDLHKAHSEAVELKKLLDSYKLPYWIMFSGNKGFNFTVDSQYMPGSYKPADLPDLNLKIAESIKNKLKLETLDLSVYQLNRVFKVPYSIAREKELVALPLSDGQFEEFNPDDYKPENVLRNVKLMNRGLLERHGSSENVLRFYQDNLKKSSFLDKIKGVISK